jgi:O-antigen ligase
VLQPSLRSLWAGVLVAGGGLVIGYAALALAHRAGDQTGALLLLALTIGPAAALAVLRSPKLGLGLVFALSPVGSVDVGVPLPALHQTIGMPLVEVGVFAVAALIVIRRLGLSQTPLAWAPQLWWSLALLAWTFVSLVFAEDQTLALKQIAVLVGGILLASIVVSALRTMDDVRWLVGALVTTGAVLSIVALSSGVHFESEFSGESVSGRLTGAFQHPNQLGLFAALGVALATGLAFGARRRLARWAAGLSAGLIVVPLLLSLSRGAWIGCALAFLYLLVALREARRVLIVAGLPLAFVAALVGSFSNSTTDFQVIGQRARAITTLSPYDNRTAIYTEAEHEIKTHPFVGVGPGNFPVASTRAGSQTATVYAEHAHDLWLTWAAEDGLPALAIILAFTVSLGRAARRAGRSASSSSRRDRAVIAGIVAALVAVVGQGVFDYLLRNAVLFMFVWTLIGALLVCAQQYAPARARS